MGSETLWVSKQSLPCWDKRKEQVINQQRPEVQLIFLDPNSPEKKRVLKFTF